MRSRRKLFFAHGFRCSCDENVQIPFLYSRLSEVWGYARTLKTTTHSPLQHVYFVTNFFRVLPRVKLFYVIASRYKLGESYSFKELQDSQKLCKHVENPQSNLSTIMDQVNKRLKMAISICANFPADNFPALLSLCGKELQARESSYALHPASLYSLAALAGSAALITPLHTFKMASAIDTKAVLSMHARQLRQQKQSSVGRSNHPQSLWFELDAEFYDVEGQQTIMWKQTCNFFGQPAIENSR